MESKQDSIGPRKECKLNAVTVELKNLSSDIRLHEVFQVIVMILQIVAIISAPFHEVTKQFNLFVIPLGNVAIGRSDYLIHWKRQKYNFLEHAYDIIGGESLNKLGKTKILLFDLPIFIGIAMLAKATSAYPASDFSEASLVFWSLWIGSAIFIIFGVKMGKNHCKDYTEIFDASSV